MRTPVVPLVHIISGDHVISRAEMRLLVFIVLGSTGSLQPAPGLLGVVSGQSRAVSEKFRGDFDVYHRCFCFAWSRVPLGRRLYAKFAHARQITIYCRPCRS